MAVLEKIRVKLGILITVLIAVALLSFIIDPSTLEMTLRSFSSKYDVGKIAGKSIRYEDFQKKVDYYTNIYNLTSGNQAVSEQVMESINQSAWQDLQNEIFIIPNIKKAGLNVGEEEMLDLSQGKELSPIISQEPSFRDASGNFSRAQLLQFIQSIPNDKSGNLSAYWNFLEKNMKEQQYFAKYTSLLSQSNILTPVELRREIEENNITANVDFVMVPFGFEQDSTLKVSNKEIEAYYKKHIDNYKQTNSRDIEFVVYEVVPSEKDYSITEDAINKVYQEFTTTDNLKAFLARNSDTPLQNYYYKKGEIAAEYPEVDEFAFSAKPTVLPVFRKGDMFIAARVNSEQMMSDSAFVQHILLPANSTQKADSLISVINKGGNFVQLASEYSLDKNQNVENPGDIGWMTQTMIIPGMEGVLTMAINKPVVINTNYGTHIVMVNKRTAPIRKVQIALLTKETISGKETFQSYYSKANDLVAKSEGKIENFDKIVKEENLPVVPANGVLEGAKNISRYENMKEVSRWIYEAKKGQVSPILTVDNKYFFVVALKSIKEEGHTPINEVSATIQYTLLAEKRSEKMKNEVAAKIAGLTTMQDIANALNTTVSNRTDVSFGSINSRTFDPSLVGSICGATANKIVGPIAGNVGVYVFQVNSKETASFYTEQDAKMKASQIQNYQLNMLPSVFEKMAGVKDNRARFF